MSRYADRLRERLAVNERLKAVHSVELSEGSSWTPVTLGVTDRRLLWVDEDDGFVCLGIDSLSTVRSRPRTTPTYSGTDTPRLLGGGVIAAVVGLLGVLAFASSAFEFVLASVLVGGLAVASSLRRVDDVAEWPPAAAVTGVVRKYDVENRFGGRDYHHTDAGEQRRLLVGVSVFAAVASFLALVAFAASLLVPLFAFGATVGLAAVDYARRRGDDDRVEFDWRREREISLSTAEGRTVHVRTDPSSTLDQELSRLAFVERDEQVSVTPARS